MPFTMPNISLRIPTITIPAFVPPLLTLITLATIAYTAYYITITLCTSLLTATQKEIERLTAGRFDFQGVHADSDKGAKELRGIRVRVKSFNGEEDYLDWTRRTVMSIYNNCEALGFQDTRRLFGVVLPGSAGIRPGRARSNTFESQRDSIDAVMGREFTRTMSNGSRMN
ncbi:hypothetical protein BJ508DRAFT_310673 [Ascobolus immersus RN42]|uniref:Uncharacterized protein n=1 Tax=Ascobolus immersus RN42 TaxID=1160509 RepID=A0A3N4HUI6_ASCIM|nr:hypothetical protein BJ508DRAFT_310673 [Ascobolus immersus RN42]